MGEPRTEREPRFGRLLRRLAERAVREAADRQRLAHALDAVLAAPADFDLNALVEAVAAGAPAVDAAGILEAGAGGYTVRAALGISPASG
ncbi:MAG TPA: hypothetical protein VFP65_03695, partial [Anaeromyxobacteraceae bacterium]|nr:hypothetical protein [Anaeromyxobacteraceae bacterium]